LKNKAKFIEKPSRFTKPGRFKLPSINFSKPHSIRNIEISKGIDQSIIIRKKPIGREYGRKSQEII